MMWRSTTDNKEKPVRIAVLIVLTTVLAMPASAQDTALHDPSISRDAQDGVIRL
jgi:accessory colonization factor AcfC